MILYAHIFSNVVLLGEEGHALLGYVSALDLGASGPLLTLSLILGICKKQALQFVSSNVTRDVPSC